MEFTHSNHNIFIIADDLGLALSVNEGIFFALKNNLIGGASLMANGETFDDAVQRLKGFPSVNIGIHLVLVEENSLTRIKLPKNHKIFFIKYVFGLIKKDDIMNELEAQIQKILGAGIKPQFINSHQHLHLIPGVMNIVISLAKKYNIPYIRIVNESVQTRGNLLRKIQLIFLNFLSYKAKNKIIKAGIKCNDFFVGFVNAGNIGGGDIKNAKGLAQKYPNKVVELGCHPGYENKELREKYKHWGNYNWERELNLLTVI